MSPTYGCPFCGHATDKIHRVQSTTACWVACSACGARGPSADDMDDAVRGWDRYASVVPRVVARRDSDRQYEADTLRADIEATPLPGDPGFRDNTKALARLMLAEVDARPELLGNPHIHSALMDAVAERHPEFRTWLETPSGAMIGTAVRGVQRVCLVEPERSP